MAWKICVMNNKGGVGKTMLCYQLAGFLSKMGYNILCVDFDPQSSLTRAFLGEEPEFNIYDLLDLKNEETIDPIKKKGFLEKKVYSFEEVVQQAYPDNDDLKNIWILPSGHDLAFAEFTPAPLYNALLKIDQNKFDYIIFDTHPQVNIFSSAALTYCDYLLGVLDESNDSMVNLNYIISEVLIPAKRNSNSALKFLGVVVNMCNPQTNLHKSNIKLYKETYPDLVFKTFVSESVKAKESVSYHIPVVDYLNKKHKCYTQFYDTTKEFVYRCKNGVGNSNAK